MLVLVAVFIDWIRSFLQNCSIKVIINGQQSTVSYINAGVPQGSAIGPTLFLVYINDLIDCVKNQVHLFADDTILCYYSKWYGIKNPGY